MSAGGQVVKSGRGRREFVWGIRSLGGRENPPHPPNDGGAFQLRIRLSAQDRLGEPTLPFGNLPHLILIALMPESCTDFPLTSQAKNSEFHVAS